MYKKIESEIQKIWNNKTFIKKKKNIYVLEMFMYPSGEMHVGHVRNYSIGSALTDYYKMKGYNVIHATGWDSLGLPAETAAKERDISPYKWTIKNIKDMKKTVKSFGFNYDWSREITTCKSNYYKWTQWIFGEMFKKGLVYKKESEVNWCTKSNSVLANEQVSNGISWRGDKVEKRKMIQWHIKITQYAKKLNDHSKIDWPNQVIKMQKNWIGYKSGYILQIKLSNKRFENVFIENLNDVSKISSICMPNFSGFAYHPLNNNKITVFSVRDNGYKYNSYFNFENENFDFDLKKLNYKKVDNYKLKDWTVSRQRAWGTPIPIIYDKNGGAKLSKIPVKILKNIDYKVEGNPLEKMDNFKYFKNFIRECDTMDTFFDSSWYYLRFLDSKNSKAIADKKILKIIDNVDVYIGGIEHAILHLLYSRFVHKFLKDIDVVKSKEPFKKYLAQGMVVSKTYYDIEKKIYYSEKEFKKLKYKENILIKKHKMSKSKNNGVSAKEILKKYGADSVRMFLLFAAPPEKELEWNENGIIGISKFLNKVYKFIENIKTIKSRKTIKNENDKKLLNILNEKISLITEIFETNYHFNSAIAHLMDFFNKINEFCTENKSFLKYLIENFLKLLHPFAPHITDYIWIKKFNKNKILSEEKWPKKMKFEKILTVIVQKRGKLQYVFEVNDKFSDEEILMRITKNSNDKFVYFRKNNRFIYNILN